EGRVDRRLRDVDLALGEAERAVLVEGAAEGLGEGERWGGRSGRRRLSCRHGGRRGGRVLSPRPGGGRPGPSRGPGQGRGGPGGSAGGSMSRDLLSYTAAGTGSGAATGMAGARKPAARNWTMCSTARSISETRQRPSEKCSSRSRRATVWAIAPARKWKRQS